MRQLFATICFLGLVGFVIGAGVFAGESAVVTTTITPHQVIISISVDPTAIDYGTMEAGESKTTCDATANWANPVDEPGLIRIENTGNTTVALMIAGANTISETGGWTLADTIGEPDHYMHRSLAYYDCYFPEQPGDNNYDSDLVILSTEYQNLNSSRDPVYSGSSTNAALKVYTPNPITNLDPQSTTVTFLGVEY